jgi:NitT/TauT family transport system permease protein
MQPQNSGAALVILIVFMAAIGVTIAAVSKYTRLLEIRGVPSKRIALLLQVGGILFLLLMWQSICWTGWVTPQLLPPPLKVLQAYPVLHFKFALVRNLCYSCYLNGMGYLEAVLICLPLGFIVGMFPLFEGMFSKQVDAIRYLPLTALTGLFMVWFGIDDMMKIQFLAVGIMVYLLPVVVMRVRETPVIYQQTAFTLGASKWKMFTTVFLPYVRSKIVLDIKVLVAISWTYVIIAEMQHDTGGIGAMAYSTGRQGQVDKTFALLFVILAVGYLQDKIFLGIDWLLNRHKYE